MGLAVILGSKGTDGIETSVSGTDLIKKMINSLGWQSSGYDYPTKTFEFFAVDNIEVSVNGNPSFILRAGDSIEERDDEIKSFVLLTDGAQYRYSAKF